MSKAWTPLAVAPLLFTALSGTLPGRAQAEWSLDQRTELQSVVYDRQLRQEGFSRLARSADAFVMAGHQLRLAHQALGFEIQPELRVLVGESFDTPEGDLSRITVRSPDRLLHLRSRLGSGSTGEAYFELERLNLSYDLGALSLFAGRKPVSLGVLKIFPLWNKFSRPLPTVAGPALVYSSDTAGARLASGEWVLTAQALAQGPKETDHVYWLESIWYSEWIEAHALASRWWGLTTAGLAAAKDLSGTTLRAEWLQIGLGAAEAMRETQLGIGGERAFSADWSALAEVLHQSKGYDRPSEYPIPLPSRFTPLRARSYAYLNVQYKISPYWTASPGAVMNLVDTSTYFILKAQHSWSESTDLFFEADLPVGYEGSEFSSRTFRFPPTSAYIGVPLQFQAGLKTAF